MKFTAQEEYGLRCLLQIGRQGRGGSLTIPEVAAAEGLSIPYVAKLVRVLRQGGFLTSTRGQSGGYALSRLPEQLVAGEVLAALYYLAKVYEVRLDPKSVERQVLTTASHRNERMEALNVKVGTAIGETVY